MRYLLLLTLLFAPLTLSAQPVLTVTIGSGPPGMMGSDPMAPKPEGTTIALDPLLTAAESGLLPIIFFDAGSDDIPARYARLAAARDTAGFSEHALIGTPAPNGMGKYYQLLDIVGARMRLNPTAAITLEGTYGAGPGESDELAEERAEAVEEYLTSIWSIDDDRITLLPARRAAEAGDNALAQEEARRVVIDSESWEILRPVRYFTLRTPLPPLPLGIGLDPKTTGTLRSVTLTAMNGADTLATASLPVRNAGPLSWNAAWIMSRPIAAPEKGVTFHASVTMADGSVVPSAPVTLPVTTPTMTPAANPPGALPASIMPISYFDAGSATLSRLQRRIADSVMLLMAASAAQHRERMEQMMEMTKSVDTPIPIPTMKSVLTLITHTEAGENPEIDSAVAAGALAGGRTVAGTAAGAAMGTIVVVPTPQEMKELQASGKGMEIYQALYGITPPSMGQEGSLSPSTPQTAPPMQRFSAAANRSIDSLLGARGDNVLAHIRTTQSMALFDSVDVRAQRMGSAPLPVVSLPEARYYQRRVDISLALHVERPQGMGVGMPPTPPPPGGMQAPRQITLPEGVTLPEGMTLPPGVTIDSNGVITIPAQTPPK